MAVDIGVNLITHMGTAFPESAVVGVSVGPVTLECANDNATFRGLRGEWQALYARCPGVTPFMSWEWLFSWWRAYSDGRSLRLLVFRSRERLVAVAPLCIAPEKGPLGLDCKVLRLVGDGSHDSDYLGFLVLPEARVGVMERFGEWLMRNSEWDAMVLAELPDSSPLVGLLQDLALRHALRCHVEYRSSGVLELPGSLEDYLRERQPRFRTKVRSLLKRLDEGKMTFECRCPPAELRGRLRSLFALHQKRWQKSGAPGVFGSVSKRRFYAYFVPRFARAGWLRLYSLRSDKTYLAHQLCFGQGGVTFLLQEGFDASNPAASYGQMLRAAVIRQLIEAGEFRYDFLGGFSRHKADWGAREGRSADMTLAPRSLRGWLYFNLPLWRQRAVATVKRLLPQSVIDRLQRRGPPSSASGQAT